MPVYDFPKAKAVIEPGGEPPDNGDMEARVATLEAVVKTLATREDLVRAEGNLRAELHKAINEQTWKIIGAMITLGTLLSAIVFFVARNVK